MTSFAGAGKSVLAVKDNYQPDFSGASRGFALCAVKGRDDTSKYSQVHAAESNQILDLLDGIKAKILAGKNVWSQSTLPNAQKALQVSTDALQKAQEQKDIAAASLKKVNDDMQASTGKDDKELDMVEKIQAMVHNLNGRGADTCSNQPDGLVTTKDDGAQMFCKGGMVRCVQRQCRAFYEARLLRCCSHDLQHRAGSRFRQVERRLPQHHRP